MITTSCKECVMAEYDNITQIDCRMNQIDKIKKAGFNVIEAYDQDK